MKKRFTHIVTKLDGLGKTIPNEDVTNKLLRYLTREWQPKITTIIESQNLNTLSIASLLRKLEEHEQEPLNLAKHAEKLKKNDKYQEKEKDKYKKSVALKASSSKAQVEEQSKSNESEDDSSSDEKIELL